jgi:type II secretory pathway component PulF
MERVMSLLPSVMTLGLGGVIGFVVLTLLSAVMSINDLAI